MKIAVLVKSALDEAELRSDSAGRPLLDGAATKMSTFDKNAVEEAVRLKEAAGGEVVAVTLGGADSKKAVKEAIAMGATGGVHVTVGAEAPDALETAYCLSESIKRLGGVEIVFCSEGASDTYQGQVGAMVAEFLDVPFLGYARRVKVDGGLVRCEQAAEGEVKVVEARLPAVVSVVSEANTPRYPTLLQVMAAGKKTIDELPLGSLAGPGCPKTGTAVEGVWLQVSNRKRVVIEGSPEEEAEKLLEALREEGVL